MLLLRVIIMPIENIVQIVDISLVVTFITIFAGLLFAIFRGVRKGIWNSTFRLFFILACFAAAIFTLNIFAKYVGDYDLTPFQINDLIINGTDAAGVEHSYTVTFDRPLRDCAYEVIKGIYVSQGWIFNARAAELAYALAESIVKYIAFMIEIIVISIFGNIFASRIFAT